MKNYKLERLQNGESFVTSEKGNSMVPLIKSGQDHRLEPSRWEDCNEGDMVYCKVKGRFYTHLVKAKNQVDDIMGGDWSRNNPELMQKIMYNPDGFPNIANLSKYKREDPLEVKQSKWIYGRELKGGIFSTMDGIFCVIYDVSLASPKRFSLDGGRTWHTREELDDF